MLFLNNGQRFVRPSAVTKARYNQIKALSPRFPVTMIYPKKYSIFFRKVFSLVRSISRVLVEKWHKVCLGELFTNSTMILLSFDLNWDNFPLADKRSERHSLVKFLTFYSLDFVKLFENNPSCNMRKPFSSHMFRPSVQGKSGSDLLSLAFSVAVVV